MISRTALVIVAAVSGAIALTSVGCSDGTIAVGSTEQALQKKKDGGPTGNGSTCSWEDTVSYDVATGTTTTTPAANGQYKVGDTFKSLDGCNSCGCQEGGQVACTEMACAPATPACKPTGCSGQLCSDQDIASTCEWTEKYACYKTAICERGTNGACGWRATAELTSCLASKP